jgi:hypothetical protein
MQGTEQVHLSKCIVHRVGNPTRGEQLRLSANALTLNDEGVRQMLVRFFLNPINEQELYCFTHQSDLAMNEVYSYAQTIFSKPDSFVQTSALLAQFLYSRSTHARVKEGELYVALMQGLLYEGAELQALGIFKSETKQSFLRVFEHGNSLEVATEDGVNLSKLDKGCLIFNTESANGFRVCVLDNTNKQQDAQYWVTDFLQVAPVANEYRHTNEYLTLCRQFATQELPEHFEVTKGQQIDLMQRSLEYFKEKEQFNLQEFAEEVIHHPDMVDQFMQYKDNYAQNRQVEFEESFDIDLGAVKKQQRVYKSVLKLDRNFHIYIHGRRDLIERGFDEALGKHYYKVYFDEES